MAKNLYGYGLDFENLYGRNTTDYTVLEDTTEVDEVDLKVLEAGCEALKKR